MDGRKDGLLDPRVGAGGLWLQALRSVFVSAPPPAPPPRWGEGRGKGQRGSQTAAPSRPLALAWHTGHFAKDAKGKPGPPRCHALASATKAILYLRKAEGYEKNVPLQGFPFGGKGRALLGCSGGPFTKAPLFPPRIRQWHRKKLSFQQKIKRGSAPRLPCFHAAGEWTPLQAQVLVGFSEEAAGFPAGNSTAESRGGGPSAALVPKLQRRQLPLPHWGARQAWGKR